MGDFITKKHINLLSIITAILALISSSVGVFYSFGGVTRTVENIYGQTITLLGDGIYQNDSIFKAAAAKGTDVVIIITALILLFSLIYLKAKPYAPFLQTGLLCIILYATSCIILGNTFNRLFLLYIVQFSCAFFAFLFSISSLLNKKSFNNKFYEKRLTGTSIFLMISACSVLQWLAFIIPTIVSGAPMEIIEIYTTEPTFVFDLAIIFPTTLFCGIMLIKRKTWAYQLTPVILILLIGVALCVISQTIVQSSMGVVISISELIGLVVAFVILGAIALCINIKMLKNLLRYEEL